MNSTILVNLTQIKCSYFLIIVHVILGNRSSSKEILGLFLHIRSNLKKNVNKDAKRIL